MRILGLDVGDKTIGVAISDPTGLTAQGIKVIKRKEENEIAKLKELIQEYEVERIVIGLPRNMNGTLGKQSHKVLSFVKKLKANVQLPVETWDERLSTVAAERVLLSADVSRLKRKKVIDKMAAAIFLQSYLDARSRN